jgi:hypothetical protein
MPTQAYGPPQRGYQPEYTEPHPSGANRPPERRRRSKGLDYTLKGLGLLAVAVVSGVTWWLIRNDPAAPAPPATQQQAASAYQFVSYHEPSSVYDCASHSYNKVKEFFGTHPCQELIRSLWTTQTSDGQKVIVSVAEVKMADASSASALTELAHQDNTGNVMDLIQDGGPVPPDGPKSLANGGYASSPNDNTVVIVLSEYQEQTKDTSPNLYDDPALKAISAAALQQKVGVS